MALEELQDLKGVWSELSKVWEQIDQMKEQPWVSVQPRKVRLLKAGRVRGSWISSTSVTVIKKQSKINGGLCRKEM